MDQVVCLSFDTHTVLYTDVYYLLGIQELPIPEVDPVRTWRDRQIIASVSPVL